MKKSEYLALPHVRTFIDYMGTYLGERPLPHHFTFLKTGQSWACNSLADALAKYQWPIRKEFAHIDSGENFQANKRVLDSLASDLRQSLAAGDSAALADAAIAVMKWGGTEKGNSTRLRNLGQDGTAVSYFQDAARVFGRESLDEAAVRSGRVYSNAGFTKIYSLLRDDFVIYDSRVAAALALLVIAYCQKAGLTQVPDGLAFRVMPAKEGANARHRKLRQPAWQGLAFAKVNNVHLAHARSNVMANWVLGEVLQGVRFHAATQAEDLRALEAALFMVGYDLTYSPVLANSAG